MTPITNDQELRAFLDQADNFHDALIRECALRARGFVDSEFRMHDDTGPFDAFVFLQTQADEAPGILLEFAGVSRFCVIQASDLRPSGMVTNGLLHFSFSRTSGGEAQVIAAGARYRFLDRGCLGENSLLCGNPYPGNPQGDPDRE